MELNPQSIRASYYLAGLVFALSVTTDCLVRGTWKACFLQIQGRLRA